MIARALPFLLASLLCCGPASAVTLGMTDTFQDGSTEGWSSGAANPNPPFVAVSGGPGGAGDMFLQLAATGNPGAGGKLVAFSGAQWAGDYLAGGVTAIAMDLNNMGATDLSLRLWVAAPDVMSEQPVLLKAGSGWTHVLFQLTPDALTGAAALALSNVSQLRLFHSTDALFPGQNIATQLGVDNISAVPEPQTWALLGAGLALIAGLRMRRRWRAPLVLMALLGLGQGAHATTVLPAITTGDIAVHLKTVASGMSAPDYAISAPGDTSRLFVVEQNGLLRVIENGSLLAAPALDIRSRVSPPLNPANANDERGFLGLAFHPGFNTPGSIGFGKLYTYTSEAIPAGTAPTFAAPNGAVQNYKNLITEWRISPGQPGVVDPTSRREIISFGKNAGNHNGGTITFGTDGYLYLGLGDGGNANDVGPSHLEPGGNAQNLSTPLGKMLRIDPVDPALTAASADLLSGNGQYRIPVGNPFQGAGQVREIYALGFRNPYRFAVDRLDLGGNGQIIIGDVGQNMIEEIDRLELGGNFGWGLKEGDFLFNRTGPNAGQIGARSPGNPVGLIDPIKGTLATLEYDHGDGISITGGFVYRGGAIPALFGKYVFGDLALRTGGGQPRADGRLFYADLVTGEIKEFALPQYVDGQLPNGLTVHGFGEDALGELYALVTNTPANGTGGIVLQITAVPEPATWISLGLGLLLLAAARRKGSVYAQCQ
ncbi:MAG: PQQ-dependent sugar dehydrogenase [Burkholderiaceae bacterium]|nr:PQQ-dependent sugar dehydrogenase [Burkholderiaceae bacterium]